jgi:hypothetical protein
MKTSKAKAISKPEKSSKSGEAVIRRKVSSNISEPSEEEIREKALELYHLRIEHEEYGTAEDDWIEAERLLRESDKGGLILNNQTNG